MVEGQTPEREVGGSILTQVAFCVLEQDTFTSQKVLVIPRKRSLLHDMTEKLLTGDVKPQPKQTNNCSKHLLRNRLAKTKPKFYVEPPKTGNIEPQQNYRLGTI